MNVTYTFMTAVQPPTTPPHLGGHYGGTAMPLATLDYIFEKYNIKSVIDIGCGPGGTVEYANYKGIYSIGIDGDPAVQGPDYIKYHDYTLGELPIDMYFDLAYSTEFLEHVEEKYIPYYITTFQKAQYVLCTGAFPGQGGHHHVNEQESQYWIDKFTQYGFTFLPDDLELIRQTSNDKLINRNGLFFKNNKTITSTTTKPFAVDYEKLKAAANHHYDANGKDVVGYERWK
ncbi:AdoMet_MTases domain containing protein [uncultured Caudovirales phage]|uniref:AdoMet_MTases domain containing protein n=1 Tax=uncultured Caudovirales phage TaxID=2100421 RepID=A0A6J7WUB5_9CAUD|nr:AdoMet_MTases domain containing protein [uncultured Caudovirales phage]